MKNKGLLFSALLSSSALLVGCGGEDNTSSNEDSSSSETSLYTPCSVHPVDYGEQHIMESKDAITEFMASVASDNRPSEYGLVTSPYFKELTVNGVSVPVYGTRTTNTLHSFAYLDIQKEDPTKEVDLTISFKTDEFKKSYRKVEVIPLSHGVTPTVEQKTITAKVHDVGNYSFVFDGKQAEALTIMIANKDCKENHLSEKGITRTLQEIEPGEYIGDNNLTFTEPNKLYFFKKGVYKVGTIKIPDNSALYFEEGTYLNLDPDNQASLYCNNVNNVGVYGHGFIEYSLCNGSQLSAPKYDFPGKGGISFNYSNDVEIKGLMINNAQTWQCCINCSTNVHIRDCMFYGYRTYADGIMLNNCQDAVIEHNFIRTGDDAFETKSTGGDMLTKNVVFQYNAAWTDKASAYGTIYESKNNTSDVHFLHNSVGFANGNWSNHLGCACVQMGNNVNAKMFDIEFDDMEIYYSVNPGMCNIFIGGSGGMGAGSGTVNNIHFKNIRCRMNMAYMLHLQTWDADNCYIGKIYMENIESNGVKLSAENYREYTDFKLVAGGYTPSMLTIDGVKCK